jgi:hypothetical protein
MAGVIKRMPETGIRQTTRDVEQGAIRCKADTRAQ